MSLYSGAARLVSRKFVLSDESLNGSMAKAMDDAMVDLYQALKGSQMSDTGKEDRRMLFVAIARGMLSYLRQHQDDMIASLQVSESGSPPVTATVSQMRLNIITDSTA